MIYYNDALPELFLKYFVEVGFISVIVDTISCMECLLKILQIKMYSLKVNFNSLINKI